MRRRVLVSGLTFFFAAMGAAVFPVLVQAHTVNPWKPCTIVGTAGADFLNGTRGKDVICGRGGSDVIAGLGGDDILRGGPGNDVMQGDAGRDVLMGGDGRDILYTYDGTHDHLNGGRGSDRAPRHDRLLDRVGAIESFS